jgi:hypothetical protein
MSPETQVTLPEDATHIGEEHDVLFGGRGVLLLELKVRFQVESEQANWREVLAKLNLEVIKDGRTSSTTFFALPDHVEELRPFLAANVTLNDDTPGAATWDFSWSRARDNSPPAVMVKSSQVVGGFPNVLDRLGALWPVDVPIEAQISAKYIIWRDNWRFTLALARAKSITVGERIHEARPTRWTIVPPSGCVSEITQQIIPDEPDFVVQGQGTYTFQWTPRFLNEVDGAIWDGLKIFLKPRRSKPKR